MCMPAPVTYSQGESRSRRYMRTPLPALDDGRGGAPRLSHTGHGGPDFLWLRSRSPEFCLSAPASVSPRAARGGAVHKMTGGRGGIRDEKVVHAVDK